MILIKQSEATATRRRIYFQCVDATDGMTPETGEAGGQPQFSTNGGAWGNTTNVLVAIGNGRYYTELTAAEIGTPAVIESRYKSVNTAEAFGTTAQIVSFDPNDAADLGLSKLDVDVSSRNATTPPSVIEIRDEMDTNSVDLNNILADTDELQTNQGNWLTATGFSTHSAADILDGIIEGALTLRETMRITLAVLAGKSSGGGTASIHFRDKVDAKDRVVATVDTDGNRTSIITDGT